MKVEKIPLMIIGTILLLLVPSVSAELIYDYPLHQPLDGFSVSNDTLVIFTACVTDNETGFVNGTLCVTVDIDGDIGACDPSAPSSGGVVCLDAFYTPSSIGSFFWRANWTNASDSYFMYSDVRNWNVILTDRTIIAVYPINNETVIGDNTDFIVNYTVDLYLPYDLTNNLYIQFYGYSSYLGVPLYSSEKKICSIEVSANDTNSIPSGLHRYGCENYMYDTYYIDYEELPNYKFWSAQLKIFDNDVIGANLLSDTGYQDYTYEILTNLAHVYPPDETVYCYMSGLAYFNGSLYDIREFCNYKSWKDKWIPFYSYLRDGGCGGGNLTWKWRNAVNSSEYGQASLLDTPNNTEDYFQVDTMISPYSTNTTYYGTNLNYTAIHLIHNWTYTCANTTIYQTGDNDLWYILTVGGHDVTNVTRDYPAYPIPFINMTAVMPSFAVYWADFFGTDIWGGLMLIALFFMLVMTILVTLNSDVVGGGAVAVFGIMVFTRIGYIHIFVMGLMLLVSGFTVVYIMRKALLNR